MNTRLSYPTAGHSSRLDRALRSSLGCERRKRRKIVGSYVRIRVQAGNDEDTAVHLDMQIRSKLQDRVVGDWRWPNRTLLEILRVGCLPEIERERRLSR